MFTSWDRKLYRLYGPNKDAGGCNLAQRNRKIVLDTLEAAASKKGDQLWGLPGMLRIIGGRY